MTFKAKTASYLPLFLMAIGTLILIVVILSAAWLASTTATLSAEVVQARQIRIAASQVQETLLNAETGQRGYLLTGNLRYLAPFQTAKAVIARNLDALDRLETANPAIQPSLRGLRRFSNEKMSELTQTVELARQGRRDAALAIVRTDRGIQAMDEARMVLKVVISNAESIVSANLDRLNRNARLLRATAIFGGLLISLFSLTALWLVIRSGAAAVRAREEVIALNKSLEDRVLRRTAALTQANEEIQRFAYIVSHDLRAPLVNIMGFTSELEVAAATLNQYFESESDEARPVAKTAAAQDLPEAVKFIRSSTGKMDRLINAILKLSREGRRDLVSERVALDKLFETIAASLKHQIEETSTTVDIAPKLPAVTSDRLALEQVFSNLFDNALKYLAPGRPGHIAIRAERTKNAVTVSVKDNGRGIAQTDHERVFELFRRAGRQDRPGEGIGLAHVRALVRRLGGDISVVSRLGEGSEFRVVLPHSLPSETGPSAS